MTAISAFNGQDSYVRKGRERGKTVRKLSQVGLKPWTSALRHKPPCIRAPALPTEPIQPHTPMFFEAGWFADVPGVEWEYRYQFRLSVLIDVETDPVQEAAGR